MQYLKTAVEYKPSSNIGPIVMLKSNDGAQMLLEYYRNALGHVYFYESMIACVLFGLIRNKGPIDLEFVKSKFEFLKSIFKFEYLIPEQDFETVLQKILVKGILYETSENGVKKINIASENQMAIKWIIYLANFIWPLIECYFGSALYIISLIPSRIAKYGLLCRKVFFSPKIIKGTMV